MQKILSTHTCVYLYKGFPGSSDSKESAYDAGDLGSVTGLGRSRGEGNGNPLQYSGLENAMDRESDGLQSMGSQRVRHNCALALFHFHTTKSHYLNCPATQQNGMSTTN